MVILSPFLESNWARLAASSVAHCAACDQMAGTVRTKWMGVESKVSGICSRSCFMTFMYSSLRYSNVISWTVLPSGNEGHMILSSSLARFGSSYVLLLAPLSNNSLKQLCRLVPWGISYPQRVFLSSKLISVGALSRFLLSMPPPAPGQDFTTLILL